MDTKIAAPQTKKQHIFDGWPFSNLYIAIVCHRLSEKRAGRGKNVYFFICVNCVLIIQFRELKFTRTQPNHIKSRPNVLRSSVHLSTALNDYILSIQLHSITFSNLSSNNQSSCKEICV